MKEINCVRFFGYNQNIYNLKTNKDVVKIAKGEFVAFLGNDDILDKDALYENVKLLNKNKSYDIIYSDKKIGLIMMVSFASRILKPISHLTH